MSGEKQKNETKQKYKELCPPGLVQITEVCGE